MTTSRMLPILALALGCGTPPSSLPAVRFTNVPPVGVVNDRLDVPKRPANRVFMPAVWHYDGLFHRRLVRALELRRDRRALGVNALDEVPDSTWFTNRIGVHDLSLDEIRGAPGGAIGSPEQHMPWTIRSTKIGGAAVGFIITDARGEKFLLKFDWHGFPETESGAHVIVGRLLWACGYNVTEDYVVYFRPEDVVLAPDAVVKNTFGDEYPLDRAELARRMEKVEIGADGRYRALVSRWLPGKALGGHPPEGVRGDDPNDRIPHELRRDLRGMYTMFAWLDHGDAQEGNFFDAWITDPRDPKRHYVEHFLIDFGKALGVMSASGHDARRGHEYLFDVPAMLASAFSFGMHQRSWEDRSQPPLVGLGMYDTATYDPGAWKQDSAGYVPFLAADRIDKFWGAKIIARFTPAQIRAAVEMARFSDPRATDYVTDQIVARQRATIAYWFDQVNPLDRFTTNAERTLCFDDLAIAYSLARAGATTYAVERYDFAGRSVGAPIQLAPDPDGHACTGALPLAADHDGYTIFEITTTRPGFTGTTFVHVARDPLGLPRVIGVWRV
jgi:hypothetical protein